MGSSQQIIAGLALLAFALSVAGRPASDNAPLPPADLPKEPFQLTEDAPKLPATPEKKKPEKQTVVTEDAALLTPLPEESHSPVDIPVVVADLPEPPPGPEAVVVISDAPRGRIFARMARTHLPAEARDADGDGYAAFPYFEPVNNPDVLEQAKHMSRTLPRPQQDQSSLGNENAAKTFRRRRVLFRDEPVIDARSADDGSRKTVPTESGVQHSPTTHTYEVREPGRETIVVRPSSIQADPEEKSKLQLIRHIHHQQFAVPFANQAQQPWMPQSGQTFQPNNQAGISLYPPVFNTQPEGYNKHSDKPITGYFPFVINDPSVAYSTGLAQSVTDVFEYGLAAAPACPEKHRTARRARAVKTLPEDFELVGSVTGVAAGTTVGTMAETTAGTAGITAKTTTETPAETTALPELREVGNLAGPVVQTITSDDDEDKVQTTIVLGGENTREDDPDDEEDDDDDDDDDHQSETALDEDDEEEESAPSTPSKGGFQKKLKDKINEIEKKVRKRVKNSQQNLHGIRKQVNRHVTEIVMHSEGGLEEAGPIVSKLVVRRGGVAIAGPGGIATAGFGGTAIVGPGGTAYTSPDSLAVAGPGARVISVPSSKLQEMFDSFRKANGRNIDAFKPSWLGTIPPDGKLVATGPVVFFNPPEQVVPGFTLS